jgi:hypothetical protein
VSEWWASTAGAIGYAYQTRDQTAPPQKPSAVTDLLPKARAHYRKLALKYHPDISPTSAETMRDLNELWQAVLEDLKKSR